MIRNLRVVGRNVCTIMHAWRFKLAKYRDIFGIITRMVGYQKIMHFYAKIFMLFCRSLLYFARFHKKAVSLKFHVIGRNICIRSHNVSQYATDSNFCQKVSFLREMIAFCEIFELRLSSALQREFFVILQKDSCYFVKVPCYYAFTCVYPQKYAYDHFHHKS